MVAMTVPKKPKASAAAKKKANVLFVRLTDDEETALMAYVNSHRVPPDRSAVAKVALREFLEKVGHWPAAK